ncbi:MAG: hypothetical protein M3R69_11575 [Acidobacteriota bacterium]|nr:hypothetical protein [Acidobacteriota bacterium]
MAELSPDTRLSHYRIVSRISAGSMGEVYLAQDTRLDRKVALKILPTELAALIVTTPSIVLALSVISEPRTQKRKPLPWQRFPFVENG